MLQEQQSLIFLLSFLELAAIGEAGELLEGEWWCEEQVL